MRRCSRRSRQQSFSHPSSQQGTEPRRSVDGEVMTKSILFGAAVLVLSGAFWTVAQTGSSPGLSRTGAIGAAAFSPNDLPIKADLASAIAADAH